MKPITAALQAISIILAILVLLAVSAQAGKSPSLATSLGISAALRALWILLAPIYLRWRNEC